MKLRIQDLQKQREKDLEPILIDEDHCSFELQKAQLKYSMIVK